MFIGGRGVYGCAIGGRYVVPLYEVFFPHVFWACHVIHYLRAWAWLGVYVDNGLSRLAVYVALSIGVDGSVERVVAKFAGVVAQQVVGFYAQVVGQVGQVLMVDAARKDAIVAVSVENRVIQEDNLVRDGLHLQVVERVVYLQWGDSRLAVRCDPAYQVDVV